LTNGATTLLFREGDLQIPIKTPKTKVQRLIRNSAKLPRVLTLSDAQEQVITVELALFRADQGTYSGADSLISFYESTDPNGVNGMAQTFMLTDSDGDVYQCRFLDNLAGGLREVKKDSMFVGTTRLLVEHTIPTDEATAPSLWLAAYDMDDNGGDLAAWTTSDPVGDTGDEWEDKSANGIQCVQATAGDRPLWKTSQINSRPAIDFISSDSLDLDALAALYDGQTDPPYSCYVVYHSDLADNSHGILVVDSSSGGITDRIAFLGQSSTGSGYYMTQKDDDATSDIITTTGSGGSPVDTTAAHILSVVIVPDGDEGRIYLDGKLVSSDPQAFVTGAAIDVDIARIGEYGATYMNGRVGEIVLFPESHSNLQRRRQEYRLSDMWNIDLTA
jgi:hypothetical protein